MARRKASLPKSRREHLSNIQCGIETALEQHIEDLLELQTVMFGGKHKRLGEIRRDRSLLGDPNLQAVGGEDDLAELGSRIQRTARSLAKYNALVAIL